VNLLLDKEQNKRIECESLIVCPSWRRPGGIWDVSPEAAGSPQEGIQGWA